ncbi:DEAD/DEAH box helicase [Hyunsoonleella pacifica]|uniref:DEAD/DEAH box helicase n=1 Tax=Hyunsoonleella pacifica TaxID=1080224 RepID=A0A4Q9FLW1_9FLAO|nr:DEAD/DEAH box helicase [Hyunsoonleella pacifica]GGD16260.1 hypothetical protein GCM10011368_17810 [Hyunsoonleella pacifica]
MQFKFPWRNYQNKLLKNFDNHIADKHFHVIAPPGSGKTILGIEIIRRLGKKTLVLTPTLTIRNQWKQRTQEFFSKNKDFQAFSFDLKLPNDIIFSTYQSLHAFYKSFENKEDYFKFFEKHQIETIVLDEAHHLKNEWWKCLNALKEHLSFFVVALTATPPYDSSRTEITKYFNLCGEIDDEIAVPDLVRENDLCPHQDFVYFSKPSDAEINFISDYRSKIADFKEALLNDNVFINFILNHRFYKNPKVHLEDIYSNTSYFSSILIFLKTCGISIDIEKLKILGFNKSEKIRFPDLELQWLELLFQNILVDDRETLISDENYLNNLEKELRKLNVFEKNRVNFIGEQLLYKSLAFSPSKLRSIVDIVSAERKSLKENLSCVILTDYIRKEFLNTVSEDLYKINKIGVIPIFQYVRSLYAFKKDIAVLTGSIILLHKSSVKALEKLEPLSSFSLLPLDSDASFLEISPKGKTQKSIVGIITKLFEKGIIKVLIGTKSLLGEGWDAPSINSLILASSVGSFVSSNQMRGRAIRKDTDNPDKTGNIWHLACIDPTDFSGGREIEILRRRFDAFVGITNTTIPFISNGFDRLNFPEDIHVDDVETLNQQTLARASNRAITIKRWTLSIGIGTKMTKQVKLLHDGEKPFKEQEQIYYFDVLRFFVAELSLAIFFFYVEFILEGLNIIATKGLTYFVYALVAAFFATFGFKFYKAVKLYIRYGFLNKKIHKFGLVILNTLNELGFLNTNMNDIQVVSKRLEGGDIICHLIGATDYENSLFSGSLTALVNPIDSPRYLIVKTNFLKAHLDIENFYPVPEIFGDKKKNAKIFQKYWTQFLGGNKLIFTRQPDGRKALLKARLYHIHNAFKKVSKEVVIWK